MTKPVTPQEMFDLWQKMVNPGGYPLQSLMFPILDAAEIEKRIAELETVEHWLKANLNMLKISIQSLEYQRAMLKGGEKFQETLKEGAAGSGGGGEATHPALWAWNMMAQAGREAIESAAKAATPEKPKARKKAKPGQ